DRGLVGWHRDHPDRDGGGPGHRARGHDRERPAPRALEGALARGDDGRGERPGDRGDRLYLEGAAAPVADSRRRAPVQHADRGRRRDADPDRLENVPGRSGDRVQRDYYDVHGCIRILFVSGSGYPVDQVPPLEVASGSWLPEKSLGNAARAWVEYARLSASTRPHPQIDF